MHIGSSERTRRMAKRTSRPRRRGGTMATTTGPAASLASASTADITHVLELIRERGVQVVDVKFTDLPGTWQHFSVPASAFDKECFTDGLGFDGSSIRGFQTINESDMLLV